MLPILTTKLIVLKRLLRNLPCESPCLKVASYKTKLVLNAIGSKESSLKFEEINFGQEIDRIPTLFPRIEFK